MEGSELLSGGSSTSRGGVAAVFADMPLAYHAGSSAGTGTSEHFETTAGRSIESWIPELRGWVVAAEEKGLEGGSVLECVVRSMVAERTATPEVLKAYGVVSKLARAAKLAAELLRADEVARHAQAAKVAEELLREVEEEKSKRSRGKPRKRQRPRNKTRSAILSVRVC